ncbi:MAG: DUF1289 domain-containing protein [Acidobacteria bacterium]|nr:DUF1289 domain-containing protein [Acidobacteriota bacterium]
MPPRPTPCIHVCEMDEEGLCKGCHRSAAEICRWPGSLGGTPDWTKRPDPVK